MTDPQSRRSLDLPKFTLLLMAVFAVTGLFLDGLPNQETVNRIMGNLGERVHGPLHFRLILQPVMVTIFAALDGYRDAKAGRGAFLQTLALEGGHRRAQLSDSLRATSRVILLGIAMDVIFQVIEYHKLYPFEAVLVAVILAYVPYVILRGPFRRFFGWWLSRSQTGRA